MKIIAVFNDFFPFFNHFLLNFVYDSTIFEVRLYISQLLFFVILHVV